MQNRIRELRKEHHMTQVRLAIELEISQETVSAYENQKHFPSFPQLLRLSQLFHASIDYIMGVSNIRNPIDSVRLGQELQQLLSVEMRMNPQQLAVVLAYAQGILDSPQ